MVLTGSNPNLLNKLLDSMNKEFRMKDLGKLHYFLGIQATFHDKGLFLSQQKYAEDLLKVAGMFDCAPMPTPLPEQLNQVPHQKQLFSNPTYFRSLAGKLQYLTLTRPDIQFAVNFVCQKMHEPKMSDFHLLKRILRYVKGTTAMGISFNKNTDFTLRAYSDNSHANCKDTRRSIAGFCTFLGNNIISWSSKRQPTVSKSSTEAEYRALSDTTSEPVWINNMLKDLRIPQMEPPELYGDNLSSIYLAANPIFHNRTKHFETHYHYVRERVALGAMVVKHVPAHQQLADIFTKPLPQGPFSSLRHKLGVVVPPTPSLQGSMKEKPNSQLKPNFETEDSKVDQTKPNNTQSTKPSKPNTRQEMRRWSPENKKKDKAEESLYLQAIANAEVAGCHKALQIETKNGFDALTLLSEDDICH
ncbi:PREDICTED: uncharacterized protein LOC109125882 [Camelina sativa]|uniref:Uncharacterized protein LOC109125882 n=1 Tax=Camelina sativa TaxID=90675 RepID=A0ABM1QBQ1_CAMSA|nr:PREDICTED: uncharacterized protein LOC109125882 [Camelina sativa]